MDLSDQFAASRGDPVELDGQLVWPMLRIPCEEGDRFRIRLSAPRGRAGQGVSLSLRGGTLGIDSWRSRDFVLWQETAPETVVVSVMALRKGAGSLLVWNCWRGPQGQEMAWLRNAGMIVCQHEDAWSLRCSDGHGDAVFDDLLVEVERLAR